MIDGEEAARAFVTERIDNRALAQLDLLATCLHRENQRQNLVSSSTLAETWLRHFADSAQLIEHVSRETGPWLDLGSGAGFPGLVIAIIQSRREVLLIEYRRLRIDWLCNMIEQLGLRNCRVVAGDAQTVTPGKAAVISARAFAPLEKLLMIGSRFSTHQTEWVLPKGRRAEQELAALPLGLRSMFHVKPSLTDPSAGIIVGRGTGRIA